ncbi:Cro/C1-type helix-turn-helix domain [Candidatus Nanopelagicaceae bacterium]
MGPCPGNPYPGWMYQQPTVNEINSTLRAIRQSKSLSLSDVETLSEGRIKAVVLGSYERGARSLSVKRALQIAALYQVPISEIFGHSEKLERSNGTKIILDLRLINHRVQQEDRFELDKYTHLSRLLQKIVRTRQDWNGEVISLRTTDIATLTVLFDESEEKVLNWLERETLLLKIR